MDKTRIGGAVICLLVVVVAGLFIWGLTLEDWRFWTIAIPIAVGVLGVMALGVWIGWTMVSTKVELPPPQATEKPADEKK